MVMIQRAARSRSSRPSQSALDQYRVNRAVAFLVNDGEAFKLARATAISVISSSRCAKSAPARFQYLVRSGTPFAPAIYRFATSALSRLILERAYKCAGRSRE